MLMLRKQLIAATLVLMMGSVSARAEDSHMGVYAGLDLGAWKYWFSQGGNGQAVKQVGDLSFGFQVPIGLRVSMFFIEYTPAYYLASVGEDLEFERDANDAAWSTYKAGNIGLTIPLIRLDVYGGGGHSCLDFSFGADSEYCGVFARVGVGLILGRATNASVRIKAEFSRQFVSTDEAGTLPEGLSTSANAGFIGLSFAFGGK